METWIDMLKTMSDGQLRREVARQEKVLRVAQEDLDEIKQVMRERAKQESAVQDILRELTAHTGSTTALFSNILRYWSSEKMQAFADALLSRCPQDDWKADTWTGAHDIAETELPRILSGWCKQPGLAAVIANYAIKVAQRHKSEGR